MMVYTTEKLKTKFKLKFVFIYLLWMKVYLLKNNWEKAGVS